MDKIIKKSFKKDFIKTICETIKLQANKTIKKKGSFTFLLSGGRTPKIVFDELVLNYSDKINWKKVTFFWIDERCVSKFNKNNNYRLAYDHLISKLPNIKTVFRIKSELAPKKAAKEYHNRIIKFFGNKDTRFDFVLLGMGKDGHVASIFPNSLEIKKKDSFVLATKKVYNGYKRITLGLNLINRTKYKLLIIKDKSKLKLLSNKKRNLPINMIKDKRIVYLK